MQLFDASKVQFSGAPSISPLTEWLLLLDATVPPNGQPAHVGGSAVSQCCQRSSLGRAPRVAVRQQAPCSLSGDERAPGFGIARSESEAIAIAFGEAMADLPVQAMLIANAIDVSVVSDPNEVHEGHDGPGARESIDATAQIGEFPFTVRCGIVFPQLVGNLASLHGPLAGVKLARNASPEASEHGTLDGGGSGGGATSSTDGSGRSHVSFDTGQEPSRGKGDRHELTANVFVHADVRPALLAADASQLLVDLVPIQVPVRGIATFRISWHDDSHHWTGTMTSSNDFRINDGTPTCAGTWTTKVTFVVGPDGKIDGTADSTLTQLGACPHPAEQGGYRQAQQIHSAVTGTATADQLRINYVATGPIVPADGIENTGYSASIFGVGTPQPPLAVAIVSPGLAQGEQSLRLTSAGSGVYTSTNTLDLVCQTC